MIKHLIFVTRALFAATAFAAVAPAPVFAQSGDRIPVNVGLPISNYWPAYVARDLKLYEQVGLEPKYYSFTTGAPLIAGMKSGSLDVAWTGLATLFMLGQGIPLKFVLVPLDSSSQMGLVVNSASGITNFKELNKSKNIGAPTATCAEVSLVLAAKAAGIPRSSLKVSNLAPNLLLGALQNGQIDAMFIWGPWNLQARDAGFNIVSWDKDYMRDGGVCATSVAIRPEFLAKHPSVGCKMVKAHAMALEAARKDPEVAIRTMQQAMGISHKLAKETYETLNIPTIKSQLEPNAPWSLTGKDAGLSEKLYVAGQALYETKAFAQPLSKETIWQSIDASYIKEYIETDCKK